MNFFVIKVGSKPYILPILFSFCYFSTLKVGKKHLKIEQNCSFDPVCSLNPSYISYFVFWIADCGINNKSEIHIPQSKINIGYSIVNYKNPLFPHNFNNESFAALAVKFGIKYLLPGAEV